MPSNNTPSRRDQRWWTPVPLPRLPLRICLSSPCQAISSFRSSKKSLGVHPITGKPSTLAKYPRLVSKMVSCWSLTWSCPASNQEVSLYPIWFGSPIKAFPVLKTYPVCFPEVIFHVPFGYTPTGNTSRSDCPLMAFLFHCFVCSGHTKEPELNRQTLLSFGVKETLTYFKEGAARKGKGKLVGAMKQRHTRQKAVALSATPISLNQPSAEGLPRPYRLLF
jgi:hypothetical protein